MDKVRPISQDLESIGTSARNQALYRDVADENKSLSLRARRFSTTECPPELLHYEIRPYGDRFSCLDISYSRTCTWDTIQTFCLSLPHLLTLVAQSCGLMDTEMCISWPHKLQALDLARNRLTRCPFGVDRLRHLHSLNLSGNSLTSFQPALLQLPRLCRLHLTGNPIVAPPKHVVQQGVTALRQFCGVEADRIEPDLLPSPSLESVIGESSLPAAELSLQRTDCFTAAQSRFETSPQSTDDKTMEPSLESVSSEHRKAPPLQCDLGYDSQSLYSEPYPRPASTDMDTDLCTSSQVEEDCRAVEPCGSFDLSSLLPGYSCQSSEERCRVFVPPDSACSAVRVRVVQDTSFHPELQPNECLVTPVVSIQPHGQRFTPDSPAVLVLPHCIDARMAHSLTFVPLHSASTLKQAPSWERMCCSVEVYADCLKLTTTHFSLFSVIARPSYPSVCVEVEPRIGASIFVPEMPGLCIRVPPGAIPGQESVSVKTTVCYTDCPLGSPPVDRPQVEAQASTCVALEPHGLQFSKPVSLSLPIPDYELIANCHNGGVLSLWTADYRDGESVLQWREENCPFTVESEVSGERVAHFCVSHFSFWKWMWNLPQSVLNTLRAGAVYTFGLVRRHHVSVRCQVLMSPPIPDRTFGMAVAVYRFGEPLRNIANYKWILADSGESRRFIKTGLVEVSVSGNFEPISEFEDNELRERINFTGEDFCLEFALKLKESVSVPLIDHQVIGKLLLKEITGEDASPVVRLNLIKPQETVANILPPHQAFSTGMDTPPTTPEQSSRGSPSHQPQWEKYSDPGHSSTSELPNEWDSGPPSRPKRKRPPPQSSTPGPSSNKRNRKKVQRADRIGIIYDDRFFLNISRDINNRWQELGIELGLSHNALQSIPVDHSSGVHMCAYIMLQEWKKQSAVATYHHLQQSLEKINLHECVHKHFFGPDSARMEDDSSDGI